MRRVSGNAQGPNTIKRCNQGSTTTTHKRSRRNTSQRLTIRRRDKQRKLWHLQTSNHKRHKRHKKDFQNGSKTLLKGRTSPLKNPFVPSVSFVPSVVTKLQRL